MNTWVRTPVIPCEIVAIQRLEELSGRWLCAYWIRRIPIEGVVFHDPKAIQAHSYINYDWNNICEDMRSSLEELIKINPVAIELIIDRKEINKILMIMELRR